MILFRTYAISLIIIIILFCTLADEIPFLSYQQTNYGSVYDVKQFSDGKLMLLTESDPGLQLVFRNGTINPINNFRILTKNNLTQVFPLSEELIIIMFCEINTNCYNGMIIDLNGIIIVDNIQLGGITQITKDNAPSIGFLGTFLLNNTINWIKFRIPDQNSYTNNELQIANGIISARMNYSITEVALFNNIDGSHAIVYSSQLKYYGSNLTYILDQSYFTINICFYNEDTRVTNNPIQIYDSVQNSISLSIDPVFAYDNINCWSGFNYNNSISNICTFPFQYRTINVTIVNVWLIAFSSVGTVFQSHSLVHRDWYHTSQQPSAYYEEIYGVIPLPFGEILVYVTDYNTYGLVDPSKSHTYETLDLKNMSSSYYFETLRNFGVIPNNTAWLFYSDSRNANWSLFIKEMPKINDDALYENSIIKSVSPNHNMTFQLPTQLDFSIDITFTIPIVKSSGNLTIYQSTQIRQNFPINSKYCNISDESTTATLRLIEDSNNIKLDKNFYDMLQQQLIDSIPLNDKDRLKPTKHINDPTSANKILMEFLITKANSTEYPDVSNIINVLDNLIQNKDASALVQYNLTKFLDPSYGFKANPSLIQIFLEVKYELLGIGILFIILFVGYFGLKKRNPKGNNLVIFKVPFI
ncbi:15800_t:CDS:2, partial [Gigaspora rosea]